MVILPAARGWRPRRATSSGPARARDGRIRRTNSTSRTAASEDSPRASPPAAPGVRARLGGGQRDRLAGGMQLQRGRVSRVQVMIEHPAGGRTPLSLAVGRLRQLVGVGAEQVVAGEPAGSVLGQQVCPGQLAESAASLVQRQAGRAGCGSGADVRAGPGEGWLELKLKLPAPLARLANRPRGRYRLCCPVEFSYRAARSPRRPPAARSATTSARTRHLAAGISMRHGRPPRHRRRPWRNCGGTRWWRSTSTPGTWPSRSSRPTVTSWVPWPPSAWTWPGCPPLPATDG